ncbi:PIN domain-containing protein [Caldimonas sp. KR1-144]|uniref:nucleotide pyrophosphohydrolase n=1 Tax=Caldimonas sp. KR1-144 TaxID=3400911 RepID=UPI003C0622C7
MNLGELQAELRHFAAERDWQPFHTPKNLATALMVESAELAEVFQWKTPDESRHAHEDPATKQRIGEEVADVLLYLLQVADYCQVDVEQAVSDKLAKNALKYPAKHVIARVSPTRASVAGTHVLLDYENVQPGDVELRALFPDVNQVWVFHGPHQREVAKRFASFGTGATAVPITKTGKNALDFHLSFYMGYIASRNPESTMVVVANDKGYEPMLEHARAMGFQVRRQAYGEATTPAKKTAAKKVPAKKTPAKKVGAKKPAAKSAVTKKVAAKKASPAPATKKAPAAKVVPAKKAASAKPNGRRDAAHAPGKVVSAPATAPALSSSSGTVTISTDDVRKLTDNLRKLVNRPTKPAALRRLLKSLLGAETGDASIEVALGNLVAAGIVAVNAAGAVTYPTFESAGASGELIN